jgi:hypothetical protein
VLPWLPKPGGAETLLGEVGQCLAPHHFLHLGENKKGHEITHASVHNHILS